MTESARELFEHELKDTYDAEHRLVKALDTIGPKLTNQELKQGLELHRQQTVEQIERLESVFQAAGIEAERATCFGIQGLIRETEHFLSDEDPAPAAIDAFITGAQLKVEHYEIVAYEMLIKLAQQCGFGEDVVGPLRENMNEELQTSIDLESVSGKALADLP